MKTSEELLRFSISESTGKTWDDKHCKTTWKLRETAGTSLFFCVGQTKALHPTVHHPFHHRQEVCYTVMHWNKKLSAQTHFNAFKCCGLS